MNEKTTLLIDNVVLITAVQKSDSIIHIYIYIYIYTHSFLIFLSIMVYPRLVSIVLSAIQ